MADNNKDLGEIKENFEHIADALDSMRAQNAMNSGDMDKVLSGINSRLEEISNDDNTDLIKVFLAEMKKNLEERHNFVSYKFNEIENSFKSFMDKMEKDSSTEGIKEVFDVIANNLNLFSKEFGSQKELLADLGLKLEELKQDDSQKRDILRNISVVKVEMEKFNNGFESLIVNLDENFKGVSQAFAKLDSTDIWNSVKKDIENIFLSSNAVLSTLKVIDHKNRELEQVITNLVTKEDFEIEREQVAKLIAQNIQIGEYVSSLPDKNVLENLTQKVDTAVGIINALKNVLNETSNQNQKMLVAQLDNLESKILNISSEEEFIGFRKELAAFADEIIESTKLMRSDLSETNSELKNLLTFLSSIDIKNTFEHFSGIAKTVEGNIRGSVSDLSNRLSQENEQNRNILNADIGGNIKEVSSKVDAAERNIIDVAKLNATGILENIQSVVSNIFSLKNVIQKENSDNIQLIDNKLQGLKTDLDSSKDLMLENSQQNFENIVENISGLAKKVDSSTEALSGSAQHNFMTISSNIGNLLQKIDSTKDGLSESAQKNFANLSENMNNLFQKINMTKESLNEGSQDNFKNIIQEFEKLSETLMSVKDGLNQDNLIQTESVLVNFEGLYQRFESMQGSLNLTSGATLDKFEKIKSNFDDISQEITLAKDSLNHGSQSGFEKVASDLQNLSSQINYLKNELSQNSQEKSETIVANMEQVLREIGAIKEFFGQVSREQSSDVLSRVERLSQEISSVKDSFGQISQEQFSNIYPIVESFSQKIVEIKDELNQNSQEKSDNIITKVGQISNEISSIKGEINQASQENFADTAQNIERLSQKISFLNDGFSKSLGDNSAEIKTYVEGILVNVATIKDGLEQDFRANSIGIKSSLDELANELQVVKESLEIKSQTNFEGIATKFVSLTDEINAFKWDLTQNSEMVLTKVSASTQDLAEKINLKTEILSESSKQNFEGIIENIGSLSGKIDSIKTSVNADLSENVSGLQATIDSLPMIIKENQAVYEDEKTTLIEQNSKSIEELAAGIRNLTKGIISKDNPFKEGVTYEIAGIRDLVERLQSDFSQSNLKAGEEVKFNFQKIEDLINQVGGSSDLSLHNVQSKLVEYLEAIQNSIQETDSKLVNSVGEILELKTDIASVAENVEALRSDGRFAELSSEINEKFEGILLNITQFSEASKLKQDNWQDDLQTGLQTNLQESSQETLKVLGEQFDNILTSLSEYKSTASEDLSEKFEQLMFKLEQTKSHVVEHIVRQITGQIGESVVEQVCEKVSEQLEGQTQQLNQSITQVGEQLSGQIGETISSGNSGVINILNSKSEEMLNEFSSARAKMEQFGEQAGENVQQLSENINQVCEKVSEQFEGQIQQLDENIGQVSERLNGQFAYKIEQFGAKVSEPIKELNGKLEQFSAQIIEHIGGQISETISSGGSDVLNILKANSGEMLNEFSSVKEKIEQLGENIGERIDEKIGHIDLDKIIPEIKSQLDTFYCSLSLSVKDNLEEDNIEILQKLSTNFAELDNKLDKIQVEMAAQNLDKVDDSAKFEDIEALKLILVNMSEEIGKVVNSVNGVSDKIKEEDNEFLTEQFEKIEKNMSDKSSILSENSQNIKLLEDTVKSAIAKLEELSPFLELSEISENVEQVIQSSSKKVFEKIEGLETSLVDNQNEFKSTLLTSIEENSSLVKGNLEELVSIKTELLEEINNTQNVFKEESSNQLSNIKSEMEEIIGEVTNAQEKLSSYKIDIADLLKLKDDDIKTQISSIETVLVEEISQNIENFKTTVQATSKDLESKIEVSQENYKESTIAFISDIKNNFYEKVEDNLDDLKSFLEVLTNRNDYSLIVDNLKAELFDKFSGLVEDVETSISSVSVKDDLQGLTQDVENSVGDLMENLYDRLLLALEDNKLSQDVFEKSEEVARRVEDLKRVVTEDMSSRLEAFGLTMDKQAEDFSNLIVEMKVSLNELKENYMDLSLNSNMEISNMLMTVQEKIEDVNSKLDGYRFEDVVESAKNQLVDEINSVKETVSNIDFKDDFKDIISGDFDAINQRLDLLSLNSNDGLENELKEIKDIVTSQRGFIDNLKSLEKLEKLSELDNVVTVQDEIKNILSNFENKLNEISAQEPEDQSQAFDIKDELNTLKREVVESVLSVFDQISFTVEAEEIKDFVEEKSEEIKSDIKNFIKENLIGTDSSEDSSELKEFIGGVAEDIKSDIGNLVKENLTRIGSDESGSDLKEFIGDVAEEIKSTVTAEIGEDIKSSLGNNFNDILSSLDMLHEKANGADGNSYDIKREIEGVKTHLQALQKAAEMDDFSEYSYTLQDVETDIAKVRMILKDLSEPKVTEDFSNLDKLDKLDDLDKLNEDIVSISTRTNKLLLTSDASYNTLKENLDDFRNIVYQLDERVKYFDTTEINNRIEQKLDGVNKLVLSSVNSDKIFNQAFMYLAEWVDNASENIGAILEKVEKVSEIDNMKQSIEEVKKALPKRAEMDVVLDSISEQFDSQQERIERLEAKIEELINQKPAQPEFDIKSIVEEVVAQVAKSAKPDAKFTKKIDGIDKQIAKLSKNIEKLTSYVDEE